MFHKWVGTLAGICAIVAAIVTAATWDRLDRVRDWIADASVPAWAFVAVAVLALASLGAAGLTVLALRSRTPSSRRDATARVVALEQEVERTLTEVSVATTYLATIDDFMVGIRRALGKASTPSDALAELEPVRRLVFDAVIQGINSARAEHIRCVFFKPRQEERGLVLLPETHYGHSPDVEKLWLWADARSAAGRAFSTGEELYIPRGAGDDARVQSVPEQRPMESLLCIPAYGPRRPDPTGVFSVDSTRPDAFTRSDREFAGVCASMLALVDFLAEIFEMAVSPPEMDAGPISLEAPDQPEAG